MEEKTSLAVLFDLDGVISDTASVHASAWKKVFDRVLTVAGKHDAMFDQINDYLMYVDGKTRLVGITDFLRSRHIEMPEGNYNSEGIDTIYGIGNAKNTIFCDLLESVGVKLFDDAIRAIKILKDARAQIGIASSSKNARLVLKKAGLTEYFQSILDGTAAEHDGIKSKPDPAFYLRAAELLGRSPAECIVVEDAISGVVSAKKAGIGYVVGICRKGGGNALKDNGADISVSSLDELNFLGLEAPYRYYKSSVIQG
jgi:beta-phosphoglucomutase family hydrolase